MSIHDLYLEATTIEDDILSTVALQLEVQQWHWIWGSRDFADSTNGVRSKERWHDLDADEVTHWVLNVATSCSFACLRFWNEDLDENCLRAADGRLSGARGERQTSYKELQR